MSMEWPMDAEYFAQHIQCSRKDKEECLRIIPALATVAFSAQGGVKTLEELMDGPWSQQATPFLKKAVQLYMDVKNVEQIRRILYQTILASGYAGPQFLEAVLITEVMAALFLREADPGFIFGYLAPSFFGIEYEDMVTDCYQAFRREWFAVREGGAPQQA